MEHIYPAFERGRVVKKCEYIGDKINFQGTGLFDQESGHVKAIMSDEFHRSDGRIQDKAEPEKERHEDSSWTALNVEIFYLD